MIIHSIAAVSLFIGFVSVVWLIVALMLIGIILIQKGKGGGLGGAFGGAGGGGGLLGTKTGDFLTWVTIGLVFLFFFLAILLVKYGKGTAPEDLGAPNLGTGTTAGEVDTSGTGDNTEASDAVVPEADASDTVVPGAEPVAPVADEKTDDTTE
jgi:preprotein translocase subunit SecG